MEFMCHAFPVVYRLKEAYRFLCYGDRTDIAMQEEERVALDRIFGVNHSIDMSTIYKEGDSIKVVSGPFVGQESRILKINRNRYEATIEVAMFNNKVPVIIGLDVIEKTSD